MILESEQHLLEECVKRSHGGTTVDFWRIRLESSVAFIKVLAGNPEEPGTVNSWAGCRISLLLGSS